MFRVVVMLEDPATTHLQCSYWGREVVGQDLAIHGPHPSSPQYGAVVLSPLQKSIPKEWCFHLHASWLGWCSWGCTYSSSSSKHGEWSLDKKSSIFVSSDHMTFSNSSSRSSRWSLANFRRAWTCAGLSTGTLRALQDFNPWWHSLLLMVFFETVVPALFRSLTRSSWSWGGSVA